MTPSNWHLVFCLLILLSGLVNESNLAAKSENITLVSLPDSPNTNPLDGLKYPLQYMKRLDNTIRFVCCLSLTVFSASTLHVAIIWKRLISRGGNIVKNAVKLLPIPIHTRYSKFLQFPHNLCCENIASMYTCRLSKWVLYKFSQYKDHTNT